MIGEWLQTETRTSWPDNAASRFPPPMTYWDHCACFIVKDRVAQSY